jgi:hypothetical protein
MNQTKALLVLALTVGALVMASCTPATTTPGSWPGAGCFDSPTAGSPDLRFNGTPGVVNNLTASLEVPAMTISTNGTCSGVALGAPYALTVVRASTEGAAVTSCVALGLGSGVGQLKTEYPGFPVDAWVCNPAEPA